MARIPNTFRPTPRRGFTLVELMLVIGIMVLILGLGIPLFQTLISQTSIDAAASSVESSVLRYRQQATTSGRPVFLVFEHWRVPPSLAAYDVSKDLETGEFTIRQLDERVEFPRFVFAEETWNPAAFREIGATVPFYEELNELLTNGEYYDFTSQDFPAWANELEPDIQAYVRSRMNNPFVLTLKPDGALEILGRENIPSYLIETDNPDGDIILTNFEKIYFIDVNPSTGQTRSLKVDLEDLE